MNGGGCLDKGGISAGGASLSLHPLHMRMASVLFHGSSGGDLVPRALTYLSRLSNSSSTLSPNCCSCSR